MELEENYKKAVEALETLCPIIEKEIDWKDVKKVSYQRHSKLSEEDETRI